MFASVFEEQQKEQHNDVQFFHVLKFASTNEAPLDSNNRSFGPLYHPDKDIRTIFAFSDVKG